MRGLRAIARLSLAVAPVVLAGCSGAPYSMFNPAGGQAERLSTLGWWMAALMLFIVLVMGALVLWGAIRRRGALDTHLPVDTDGGKRWILIGGIAVPVAVLSSLFVVAILNLRAFPAPTSKDTLEIEVIAHQWWWEVNYHPGRLADRFSSANEIHIPVGQPVRIKLLASDVIHSFWIPQLHGKMDAIPGHENSIVLQADEPGVFRGQCAEFCGAQHAHMKFMVVAQPANEFANWAQHQREPAIEPTNMQLLAGREAFEQYACSTCHTIRGTDAKGKVAPDLTHFGSRMTIAGFMHNKRPRLDAWIINAQSLKPGTRMPNLDEFDGDTLNALSAYLESLE